MPCQESAPQEDTGAGAGGTPGTPRWGHRVSPKSEGLQENNNNNKIVSHFCQAIQSLVVDPLEKMFNSPLI